jgi:general secretion pathway protein J
MRAGVQAGYSLVELLVVVALMGLIAVAISGGMRFGARVWERTENAVQSGDLARGGHAFLGALLSHVYPRRPDPNKPDRAPPFAGAADRMEFVAVAPSSLRVSGLARISLAAERAGNQSSLSISYRAERGPVAERREVLLTGAREIDFAYGKVVEGAVHWTSAWQGEEKPPALIRIRMSFPPESGVSWPDLVVRPLIDRDAACIFDPVSSDCRRG